jgi:hypothetical protein
VAIIVQPARFSRAMWDLLGFVGTPNGSALQFDPNTNAVTSIGAAALPNPPVGPIAGPTPRQLLQMDNQHYGNHVDAQYDEAGEGGDAPVSMSK